MNAGLLQFVTPAARRRASAAYILSFLLILLFLAGVIGFFQLMPPFENSDELGHVGYVIYLARHFQLPRVQSPPPRDVFDHEGFQAPLYYISAALLLGGAPPPARPLRNPAFHHAPAHPGSGPHRLFLPIESASSAPLRAMAAACRRVRVVSIAWGLLAAICAAALFWQFAKGDSAQAGLALTIFLFNPRWMETAASAGNDVAAVAAATGTLLFMIHLFRKKEITLVHSVLLGICCSAATLTKFNNVGLIVLATFLVFAKARQRWSVLASFLVASVLPLIPWLIRNHLLYGDFLATDAEQYRYFVSVRDTPFGIFRFFSEEFQGFRWSYFAVFGQFGVLADPPVYPALDAFLLVSGIGAIAGLVTDVRSGRGTLEKWIVLFPLLWIAVIFTEFTFYNRIFPSSQGRLIFPASACIAHLLARGCLWLTPAKGKIAVAIVVSALFIAFAFYVVFSVLPRAYPPLT